MLSCQSMLLLITSMDGTVSAHERCHINVVLLHVVIFLITELHRISSDIKLNQKSFVDVNTNRCMNEVLIGRKAN